MSSPLIIVNKSTVPVGTGASIKRVEDPRFLRGQGRYIDDIKLRGMAHAETATTPDLVRRIATWVRAAAASAVWDDGARE